MRFKRIAALFFALCTVLLAFSGCLFKEKSARQVFKDKTGVNLPEYEFVSTVETHGGFHGDGSTFYVFNFNEEKGNKLADILSESKHWSPVPVNQTVGILLYNNEEYNYNRFDVPHIENGCYFFYDEQSKSYYPPSGYLENSYSFNFRIAIYDSDNYKLYYYELDT